MYGLGVREHCPWSIFGGDHCTVQIISQGRPTKISLFFYVVQSKFLHSRHWMINPYWQWKLIRERKTWINKFKLMDTHRPTRIRYDITNVYHRVLIILENSPNIIIHDSNQFPFNLITSVHCSYIYPTVLMCLQFIIL